MLKRGFAELDPMVALVDTDACTWCGKCLEACPYDALEQVEETARRSPGSSGPPARVAAAACRCVPADAIDLQGYTDAQIKTMIDGLLEVSCT